MNIGILIFVISVIISIISAIRDKSHEERRNRRPPQRNVGEPTQKPERKKGFFEQLEEAFSEFEESLSDETDKPKRSETSRKNTRDNQKKVYHDNQLEKEIYKEQQPEEIERAQRQQHRKVEMQQAQQHKNENSGRRTDDERRNFQEKLEQELADSLFNVRSEIDREKEKQLSRIEHKARAIIEDKNLTERTKRYRLKQLLNSKSIEQDMTHQSLQFDKDPIVNGLIWQEVLERPKRL
ncbi:hypothetical protein E2556_08885 [Staphylococcus croceilyticus]|uniref:Staphylococcal protein n=1 Tax=Staphylococcus croceilyticus TaxID=319942 RepID=A0ABY2KBK0_9STAP|nr:hypothetical protein [Staphylococcus croceilyticus]PNZ66662.1 hypothetical protein CD128_09800 [Staphylococcus croceilyticus]TGA76959.1 hypothetical protein E2556_08885 [Staphylococcus croceilyticus]